MSKRTRNTKTILGVVGFLAFFYTLGTVGAVETDAISLGTGFIRSMVGVSIFGACVTLNNWIDDILYEAQRRRQRRAKYSHSAN